MHELLSVRAAELSRLATTARSNLDQAEALVPVVNRQLAELATMGVEDLRSKARPSTAVPKDCRSARPMTTPSTRPWS